MVLIRNNVTKESTYGWYPSQTSIYENPRAKHGYGMYGRVAFTIRGYIIYLLGWKIWKNVFQTNFDCESVGTGIEPLESYMKTLTSLAYAIYAHYTVLFHNQGG